MAANYEIGKDYISGVTKKFRIVLWKSKTYHLKILYCVN